MSNTTVLNPETQHKEMIVMHNNLIRGKYKYSLAELKFILTVVSMIKKSDKEFFTYQLKAKDFADLMDSKHRDEYSRIKKLGFDLMSKPIIIDDFEQKEFKIRGWFSKFDYKSGTIFCSFDNDLKPYLLHLQGNFTRLILENFIKMKSRYGMLLYMVAKSWEGTKDKTWTMSVEDFKDIMGVTSKAYDRYNNLKNKVLDPAINEINRLTMMQLNYKAEKPNGRKIEMLVFTITKVEENAVEATPGVSKGFVDTEIGDDAQEIVDLFIKHRKEIQSDFDIFISSGKNDPYQTMQQHLNTGLRTKDQYFSMIQYIFDSNEASFWRKTILNIDSLIKNYSQVELLYLDEKKDDKFIRKVENRIIMMRQRGHSEEEIVKEVQNMTRTHKKASSQLTLNMD